MSDIKCYIDSKNYLELEKEIKKDPTGISYSFSFTEDIIDRFENILNWEGISARTENLSEEFIYKYIDRFNLYNLIYTRNLSGDFLYSIVNHFVKRDISLELIFFHQNVNDFYKDKLMMIRELAK